MSREYYIYCHTAPNGKRYIGQTCLEPERRWNNGNGYSTQQYFKRAIDKYGWDNFEHVVLCSTSSKEYADFLEQWFIEKNDTTNGRKGYNIAKGGAGPNGVLWDDDRKAAWSKALKGKGNPMYGRHHTKECREKMSQSRKGKEVSPEMREFRTNVLLEANKRRRKPIRQLDLDGNLIATYPGMGDLEKLTGYNHSFICNACQGKRDTAYGFRWEYEDEELRKKAEITRSQRKSQGMSVIQYDLDGNEIARYASLSEAERKTGLHRDRIGDCCHGGMVDYGGFSWAFADPNQKEQEQTAVLQVGSCGIIARFGSLAEASRMTGVPRYQIRNCCCGRKSSAGGFKWEFADEEQGENRTMGRIEVFQYDLDGNLIARYRSLKDAMIATGQDRHRIAECCRGECDSYRETIWRYQSATQEVQPQQGLFY